VVSSALAVSGLVYRYETLAIVGIIATVPALLLLGSRAIAVIGAALARRRTSPTPLLSGRRMGLDPRGSSRAVAGLGVAVYCACLTAAWLTGNARPPAPATKAVAITAPGAQPTDYQRFRALVGDAFVADLLSHDESGVSIGTSCVELAAAVRSPESTCSGDPSALPPALAAQLPSSQVGPGTRIGVAAATSTVVGLLVVPLDGEFNAIRDAVAASFTAASVTLVDEPMGYAPWVEFLVLGLRIGAGIVCSTLLVVTVDRLGRVRLRRSMLDAFGVPRRLQLSVEASSMALSTAAVVIPAFVAGTLIGGSYLLVVASGVSLWRVFAPVGLAMLAMIVLAFLLALVAVVGPQPRGEQPL
jgi:hypothetical protein